MGSISGVISPLIWIISIVIPRITTHEPPSTPNPGTGGYDSPVGLLWPQNQASSKAPVPGLFLFYADGGGDGDGVSVQESGFREWGLGLQHLRLRTSCLGLRPPQGRSGLTVVVAEPRLTELCKGLGFRVYDQRRSLP